MKQQWWIVENTGWSNGSSWFGSGGTKENPLRFTSEVEAIEYAQKKQVALNDSTTKWRYTHVTVERLSNRTITTETWVEV
jgi:hypothetical protein